MAPNGGWLMQSSVDFELKLQKHLITFVLWISTVRLNFTRWGWQSAVLAVRPSFLLEWTSTDQGWRCGIGDMNKFQTLPFSMTFT